jgi:phosphatidylglycerophosphatase A
MNFKQKSVICLATGCFIGNISFAPGTFGSILGLPLCFLLSKINLTAAALFVVIFILFAIWIAQEAENVLKKKDPGCIVIDEIAGLMVTLIGLPFNIISVATGFLIFRVLDVLKPYPIRAMERKLSGGAGIVMDDVVAGIFGNLILRFLLSIFQ